MHFKAKLATAVLAVAGVLGGLSLAAPAMAGVVPTVTSVAPGTGPASGGAPAITIMGSFPEAVTSVHFGVVNAPTFTQVSATEVTVVPPAGHGLVSVRVSDVDGPSASTGSSEYLYAYAPAVAIKNAFSHLCLSQGAGLNGSHVTQQVCDGSAAQQWTFETNHTIHSFSGRCLDVTGFGTRNGAKVQTWDCHGGSNQSWRPHTAFAGTFYLRGLGSGKVLDDTGYSTSAGTQVQIWNWNDTDNQAWVL